MPKILGHKRFFSTFMIFPGRKQILKMPNSFEQPLNAQMRKKFNHYNMPKLMGQNKNSQTAKWFLSILENISQDFSKVSIFWAACKKNS